ncbi:hypothetical protein PG996_016046 [Apiospora saccharicola]|uniref:Uncharacterized protein n=1 Tax=Apiospora saccharicola TaxID=335842 RepID=A0ABR1TN38_9PEZI
MFCALPQRGIFSAAPGNGKSKPLLRSVFSPNISNRCLSTPAFPYRIRDRPTRRSHPDSRPGRPGRDRRRPIHPGPEHAQPNRRRHEERPGAEPGQAVPGYRRGRVPEQDPPVPELLEARIGPVRGLHPEGRPGAPHPVPYQDAYNVIKSQSVQDKFPDDIVDQIRRAHDLIEREHGVLRAANPRILRALDVIFDDVCGGTGAVQIPDRVQETVDVVLRGLAVNPQLQLPGGGDQSPKPACVCMGDVIENQKGTKITYYWNKEAAIGKCRCERILWTKKKKKKDKDEDKEKDMDNDMDKDMDKDGKDEDGKDKGLAFGVWLCFVFV